MNQATKKVLALSLLTALLFSSQLQAKSFENEDVQKIREEVKNAGPHDWHVLAKSAEKCFHKNVNTEEALEWINLSIDINPNAKNLAIKGDYYYRCKMPDEAIKCYIKAIDAHENHKNNLRITALQVKIERAKKLKSKGY